MTHGIVGYLLAASIIIVEYFLFTFISVSIGFYFILIRYVHSVSEEFGTNVRNGSTYTRNRAKFSCTHPQQCVSVGLCVSGMKIQRSDCSVLTRYIFIIHVYLIESYKVSKFQNRMIVRFKITAIKLHFQNIIFKFLELYSQYYVFYSL